MRGAYVATPLPAIELLLPYDWDPSWPYPGAHPPGYKSPRDPEIVFRSPPTPEEEIKVDEEITIAVILREETHGLPMPTPEVGSSSITWYAVLDDIVIWTATSSWSIVSGYPGATKTFTPPLTEEDYTDPPKTLTFSAESTVVYDSVPYSVSAEHEVEIKAPPMGLSWTAGATSMTSTPLIYPWQQWVNCYLEIYNTEIGAYVCKAGASYWERPAPWGEGTQEEVFAASEGAIPDGIVVTRSGYVYDIQIPIGGIGENCRYRFYVRTANVCGREWPPTQFSSPTHTGSLLGELSEETDDGEEILSTMTGGGASPRMSMSYPPGVNTYAESRIGVRIEPGERILRVWLLKYGNYDDYTIVHAE